MGGVTPDVDMGDWMRSTQKSVDIEARRPNPGWRLFALENRGLENKIINGACRINQRAYVSGASLIPGLLTGFGHDRWQTAGRTNLVRNPRFGVAGATATDWGVTPTGGGSSPSSAGASGGPSADIPTYRRFTITGTVTQLLVTVGGVGVLPVRPGNTYRHGFWVRSSTTTTISSDYSTLDISGVEVTNGTNLPTVALVANTWTWVPYGAWVPVGAAVAVSLRAIFTGTMPNGTTIDVTGAIMTEGSDEVAYFDGAVTGSVWSGSAHASVSVNRPVLTSYTYTQTPQGAVLTLVSGGGLFTVIERGDIPAGTYIVGHSGTATLRVYNKGAAPGVFAAGPITVELDGTADVVVEFEASGGTATIDRVWMYAGAVAFPFEPRPIQQELALCQRYFYKATSSGGSGSYLIPATGVQESTTVARQPWPFPVRMRTVPILNYGSGGLTWTDHVNFSVTITTIALLPDFNPPDPQSVWLRLGFAATGAALRPGTVRSLTTADFLEAHAEMLIT